MNSQIEEFQKPLDHHSPTPRMTSRKRVRAEKHSSPNLPFLQEAPDTRGVAAHEIPLEFLLLSRLDDDLGQPSEAGRHAIDRVSCRHCPLDEDTAIRHRVASLVGKPHLHISPMGYPSYVLER
jgi:hypothetical protein